MLRLDLVSSLDLDWSRVQNRVVIPSDSLTTRLLLDLLLQLTIDDSKRFDFKLVLSIIKLLDKPGPLRICVDGVPYVLAKRFHLGKLLQGRVMAYDNSRVGLRRQVVVLSNILDG